MPRMHGVPPPTTNIPSPRQHHPHHPHHTITHIEQQLQGQHASGQNVIVAGINVKLFWSRLRQFYQWWSRECSSVGE